MEDFWSSKTGTQRKGKNPIKIGRKGIVALPRAIIISLCNHCELQQPTDGQNSPPGWARDEALLLWLNKNLISTGDTQQGVTAAAVALFSKINDKKSSLSCSSFGILEASLLD